MDSLWHTVEVNNISGYNVKQPAFYRGNSLNNPEPAIRSPETMSTWSPSLGNLYRTRILKVQNPIFLDLFWEQGASPLHAIPLQEFSIHLKGARHSLSPCLAEGSYPYLLSAAFENPELVTMENIHYFRHWISQSALQLPKSVNMEAILQKVQRSLIPPPQLPPPYMQAILQILGRSNQLSTFSITTDSLSNKMKIHDQARLLASLPATLQKLNTTSTSAQLWHVHPSDEQRAKAWDLIGMKKGGFENLTSLSIVRATVLVDLLPALLKYSPKLKELIVDGKCGLTKKGAYNYANGNFEMDWFESRGWKTLGFVSLYEPTVKSLRVAVILQDGATLVNVRITACRAFDSNSIQKLLCSAPNLKRFDCIIGHCIPGELEPYSLMAMDIAESKEEWVCLGLETFKCYIGGVPRPDITSMKNGRPLNGIYNDGTRFSAFKSRKIQRVVLAQLGRLTRLREITLGKDVVDISGGRYRSIERNMEGIYYSEGSTYEYELGSQYQCLTMSLQDGLDELRNLKCLRRLTLEKMSISIGEAEQRWMKNNWPEFGKKSRDTFWTSRGFSVAIGTTLLHEKYRDCDEEQKALEEYDWW
ncbi:hypothetical protein EMPS_00711 [Entomortierella parvispora]|uniref:Uncharacterized protein n=1 Tax=Entomortierella parvispora TaxID=205924 RepID=A0A9P3LS90_9FUNG|nr:hypothetical protein EMPS_00711 [Entomortierella parvispora]